MFEQYDSGKTYTTGSKVYYMGEDYQATRNVERGRTPTFNTFDWRKLSEVDDAINFSSKSNDDDSYSGLSILGSVASSALEIGADLFTGGGGDFGGAGGGGDC